MRALDTTSALGATHRLGTQEHRDALLARSKESHRPAHRHSRRKAQASAHGVAHRGPARRSPARRRFPLNADGRGRGDCPADRVYAGGKRAGPLRGLLGGQVAAGVPGRAACGAGLDKWTAGRVEPAGCGRRQFAVGVVRVQAGGKVAAGIRTAFPLSNLEDRREPMCEVLRNPKTFYAQRGGLRSAACRRHRG